MYGHCLIFILVTKVSSGMLARESITLENFTMPNQILGEHPSYYHKISLANLLPGLVNSTNVTLTNEISGVLGLGFPRLSTFATLAANGEHGFASSLLKVPLEHIWSTRHSSRQ